MKEKYDFEQEIMACWHIVDDIDYLLEMIVDKEATCYMGAGAGKDKVVNVLAGLSALYGGRFAKLHSSFEKMIATKKSL
jgi:hypothetical protein